MSNVLYYVCCIHYFICQRWPVIGLIKIFYSILFFSILFYSILFYKPQRQKTYLRTCPKVRFLTLGLSCFQGIRRQCMYNLACLSLQVHFYLFIACFCDPVYLMIMLVEIEGPNQTAHISRQVGPSGLPCASKIPFCHAWIWKELNNISQR